MAKKKDIAEDISLTDLMKPQARKDLESAMYDVFKDLTDKDKAETLTQLSDNEIKTLLRLELIGKMRKNDFYGEIVKLFMKLRVSKDRQSRAEILKAIKHSHPEQQGLLAGEKFKNLLS